MTATCGAEQMLT